MADLDPLFGLHAQSLNVQRQRMEVLASNLANADTPHYQARDIDFAKVLSATQQSQDGSLALAAPSAGLSVGTAAAGVGATPALSYRVPLQPSVDGNTVDEQVEQSAYADAAMHYQASLSFLNNDIKALTTAIAGQ